MLFSHRFVRLLGVSTAASAVLLSGATSAGAATTLSVTAQCSYPVGGVQPASFTVAFPDGLQAGDTAPGSVVSNFTSAGAEALGATVEFARNGSRIDTTYQGATTYGNPYFSTEPFSAPTNLSGPLPASDISGAWLTYPQPGTVSAQLTGLTLNLRAYYAGGGVRTWFTANDSDRNPETVDVPCTLDSGQVLSSTFAVAPRTRPVDTTAPSTPGPITVSEITQTSAKISWGASTDDQGVDRYNVFIRQFPNDASIPVRETSATSTTIRGLGRDTAYTVEVKALDRGPNVSASVTDAFATRRLAADQAFALSLTGGATSSNGRATASLPLAGTLTGTVAAADDTLTGALRLSPTAVTFTRPNGQTITATATFTPAGETTGSQADGPWRSRSTQNVAFGDVKLKGTIPLSTPSTCRLAQPAVFTLSSGESVFYPQDGGSLTGTLTLGRLTNCGAFGALVGPDLGTSTDLWVSTTPSAQ